MKSSAKFALKIIASIAVGHLLSWYLIKKQIYDYNVEGFDLIAVITYVLCEIFIIAICFYLIQLLTDKI